MSAFRIGRKPAGPWVNMTPPIRGGVYRTLEKAEADVGADADAAEALRPTDSDPGEAAFDSADESETGSSLSAHSSQTSLTSHCASSGVDDVDDKVLHAVVTQRRRMQTGNPPQKSPPAEPTPVLSRTQYADAVVQSEIDESISGYPSLSPLVQQDIVAKYRQLHDVIRDQGLYDCPYIEYGKECARYLGLFTAFLVTLRFEWYMTSAAFLGLFWHQIMFTAHDAGRKSFAEGTTSLACC